MVYATGMLSRTSSLPQARPGTVATRPLGGTPHRVGHPPVRVGLLIVILGALTAVGPLATDMYVPGFPSMGTTLDASSSAVQLTMTAFLVGLVVGQLVIGPVSDSIGRRALLIWGTAGFTVFSVLCAVVPSVELLTVGRFLQGACGAVGMVLARTVIMDLFSGADIPRYFALLSQILGVAPVFAPIIGGAILAVSTWRATFLVLAVVGIALVLCVTTKVPESLPAERRTTGGLGKSFATMTTFLADRTFMGYVLVLAFGSAAMFVYIGGSSFVFENLHGVSSTMYSLIFATNAVGMLIAGAIFARFSRSIKMNTMLMIASAVTILGALGQLVVLAIVGETLAGTWICLFVSMTGLGLIFPAATTLGQSLGRRAPGAASALLGGLQFLFGAVASPIVGLFTESSSMPMATIMSVAFIAGAISLLALSRPWRGHGEYARPHVAGAISAASA
jgi:Bcr/CflA subfamily drug resistance transporter